LLKTSAYKYKKEHSVAFKKSQTALPAETLPWTSLGELTMLHQTS